MSCFTDRLIQSDDSFFVRCVGVSDSYIKDILELDTLYGGWDYVRVNGLMPPQDKDTLERLRIEALDFESSFEGARVLALYRSSVPSVNPSIENNLVISLLYWRALLESDKGVFVYSGKTGYKEYLFCYMAYLLGWQVFMLMPVGEGKLSEVLTVRSEQLVIGEEKAVDIPTFVPPLNSPPHSPPQRRTVPEEDHTGERSPITGNVRLKVPPRAGRHGSPVTNGNRVNIPPRPDRNAPPPNGAAVPPRPERGQPPTGGNRVNIPPRPDRNAPPPNGAAIPPRPDRGQPPMGGNRVNIPPRPDRNAPPPNGAVPPRPARSGFPPRTPIPAHSGMGWRELPPRPQSRPPQNAPAPAGRVMSWSEIAGLSGSVVRLEALGYAGATSVIGSGVVINRHGYILTGFSMVRDSMQIKVRVERDEHTYYARVIKYHTEHDLAVLKIECMVTPLTIYTGVQEPTEGQPIYIIGSGGGRLNNIYEGKITGFKNYYGFNNIVFSSQQDHGSTGGALLNSCGELIGLCFGTAYGAYAADQAVSCRMLEPFVHGFL